MLGYGFKFFFFFLISYSSNCTSLEYVCTKTRVEQKQEWTKTRSHARNGIVWTKVDLFSYGELLLDILRGKKKTNLYHSDHPLNLIGYVSNRN